MTHRILAVCLLLVPSTSFAQQGPSLPPEPVVVTSGEGIVRAVPDRAWITITAESRASNPRQAQRRNAEAMQEVQDELRGAGIPAGAIRTVAYDLQQEFDYVEGRRISRGYLARNAIEVRVDDLDRVGELLELSVGSGATSVSGLRFDLKDRARLEREALQLAVADARGKAEAAAAGAGRSIDRIVRIDEAGMFGGPIPPPRPLMRESLAQAAADAAPPISAGETEIHAQVTLTAVLR